MVRLAFSCNTPILMETSQECYEISVECAAFEDQLYEEDPREEKIKQKHDFAKNLAKFQQRSDDNGELVKGNFSQQLYQLHFW